MNYLFCKLNRNELENTIIDERCLTEEGYDDGRVKLEIRREQVGKNQQFKIKNIQNILIALIGELHDDKAHNYKVKDYENDIDLVASLYFKYGIKELQNLNGFYTIVILDYNLKKAFCIQDRHTSYDHIYYYYNREHIYIGTNVTEVLNEANLHMEVDTTLLPTYLHYGFVPGQDSIFKGIKKIPSNHFLEYSYDEDELSLETNKLVSDVTMYKDSDKSNIINYFDDILEEYTSEKDDVKIGFSLSGGFDSNFIVSRALKSMKDKTINVFSYGYDDKGSEINKTDRIVQIYREKGYKMNHVKHYAKTEDLFKLPKLIKFLQEPRLEPGLLFHYCLSEKMDEQGIKILIGGECHDQVYDKRLYYEMINRVMEPKTSRDYPMYGRLRLGEIDRMHTYKYFTDIETQWLLNNDVDYSELKVRLEVYSDVFVNYFMTKRLFCRKNNINIRLPYIDDNYVKFIEANLEEPDLPFKAHHKKICKDFMDTEILKELDKPTEASSPYSYLFLADDEIREKLFSLILDNQFCSTYFNRESVHELFHAFDVALNEGRSEGDFYKASILSCRIFEIVGLVVWYSIFILQKDSNAHLYDILKN